MEDLEKNSIKQFNQWATWYDVRWSYWPFFFANQKVLVLLNPAQNTSFLDIGCGTGVLLKQLAHLNRQLFLYGLDISAAMIQKTQTKLGNKSHSQLGTATHLPYASNSFDYVTCCTSLHHHPDTEKSLAEMYRVLKPGGKAAILDIFVDGYLRKLRYKLDNIIFQEGTTYAYTSKQLYQRFQKIGFTNITQQTYWYFKLLTIADKS